MAAAHLLGDYHNAGYCHVLLVMDELASCQGLQGVMDAAALPVTLRCGVYRDRDDDGKALRGPIRAFAKSAREGGWWTKWYTTARAVVLGYNVMAVDTDTVPLSDFYWRVKQPPYSGIVMMSQAEKRSPKRINGGFTYVHNAAPNGPSAWVLYEVIHRTARFLEDSSRLASLYSKLTPRFHAGGPNGVLLCDDQNVMMDAVASAAAGRPLFIDCMRAWETDPTWRKYAAHHGERVKQLFFSRIAAMRVTKPASFADYALTAAAKEQAPDGAARKGLHFVLPAVNLSMPNAGGEWPAELGGDVFSPRGDHTKRLWKDMQALGVPLWPDPEDASQLAAARRVPHEAFAWLPVDGFLEGWYLLTGLGGRWYSHLQPSPTHAIGHQHNGWGGTYGDRKAMQRKLSGHWDWAIEEGAFGLAGAYYAAQQDGAPLQRIVAYRPGVMTAATSLATFLRAVEGLARLALVADALVAWPAVPCNVPWLLPPGAQAPEAGSVWRMSFPWDHLGELQTETEHQMAPFGPSLDSMQCQWMAFAMEGCMYYNNSKIKPGWKAGGLTPVDFDHLLGGDAAWALGYDHTPRGGRYERFRKQLKQREAALSCGARRHSRRDRALQGDATEEMLCTPDAIAAGVQRGDAKVQAGGVPDKDGAPQILWLDAPVWVEDLSAQHTERLQEWRQPKRGCVALRPGKLLRNPLAFMAPET